MVRVADATLDVHAIKTRDDAAKFVLAKPMVPDQNVTAL